MRIAVIGAGNVGGTLGRRWGELGHDVVFAVRDPSRGASAVKGGDVLPPRARVASPQDAVRGAEVVLLATPWAATRDALDSAGAQHGAFDGVTLLDATNPLGPGVKVLAGANGESGAEQIQAIVPRARVVKIFNTTGYENMRDPNYNGVRATMFYAGDDAGAKQRAHQLAESLGFDPVDAGALTRARDLEHMACVWIALAVGAGVRAQGREIAFHLARR